MTKLKVLDLFSGIGGFSLGLERTGGFETVAFCEIDKFCQKVLKKHWPDVPIHNDVRTLEHDGPVDVITGGFPCQNLSSLGDRTGLAGNKSGLWKNMAEHISAFLPSFVLVENVPNLLRCDGGGIDIVLGDLSGLGYNAWHDILSMATFGASHLRERLWLLAWNSNSLDVRSFCSILGREIAGARLSSWERFKTQSQLARDCHGIPDIVDRHSALGNAVYPQIPEMIGRAILEARAA